MQLKRLFRTFGLATLAASLPLAASADEHGGKAAADSAAEKGSESSEGTQRRCLSLNQIRRIEVVDDQTLKFHMHGGGPDYLNHLPYRCTGLKRRGAFMHATSTSNYCDLDIITQIDTMIGMRLGSCPLGKFEAVERASKGEDSQAEK